MSVVAGRLYGVLSGACPGDLCVVPALLLPDDAQPPARKYLDCRRCSLGLPGISAPRMCSGESHRAFGRKVRDLRGRGTQARAESRVVAVRGRRRSS